MLRFWLIALLLILITLPAYAQIPVEEDDSSTSSSLSVGAGVLSPEKRLEKLERQVRNQSDLLKQIEAITQQVKDLQGQLEVAVHDIKILKEQQKNQYSDLDQRLGNLSHQEEVHPHLVASEAKVIANSDENKGQKAYEAAYASLKDKNYDKAKTALQKFIHTYPKDTNIPNAYYWLGNIYLLKNQPDKAIAQFKMAIKTDTQHTQTADALFKLGLAYLIQNDVKQARLQFKKVKQDYPDSQAAKLASEKLRGLSH